MIYLDSPSTLRLTNWEPFKDQLVKVLSFKSKQVEFEIKRFKRNVWFADKYGSEAFQEHLDELKASLTKTLVWRDGDDLVTYSGLLKEVLEVHQDEFKAPPVNLEWPGLPWVGKVLFKPHKAQEAALAALLSDGLNLPKAISLPTGVGKTYLMAMLINKIGLKTLILVPSIAIGRQLYGVMQEYFGRNKIGLVGDTKKEYNKLITIALGQSLANIKENTKEWSNISSCKVLLSDEAHSDATDSFAFLLMNICKDIPYRFFVSATNFRNDNSDLLLKGLIGETVYSKSFEESVNDGLIAKPTFINYEVNSNSSYTSSNELAMMTYHWYKNAELHEKAAKLTNKLVENGHKVMIMLDRTEQFKLLYNHLKFDFRFAHGPLSVKVKKMIPKEYHDSDVDHLVKSFNSGNYPILIGTGVLGTGVDTRPVTTIINLQAGSSKVKFTQLVGRGTRTTKDKKSFNFIDFDVPAVSLLHYQFIKRMKVYRELYDQIKEGIWYN